MTGEPLPPGYECSEAAIADLQDSHKCSAGYYCASSEKKPCPAGTFRGLVAIVRDIWLFSNARKCFYVLSYIAFREKSLAPSIMSVHVM